MFFTVKCSIMSIRDFFQKHVKILRKPKTFYDSPFHPVSVYEMQV